MTLDELEAKQSISEGPYRYCRSLDRMDRDVYGTVFEPGASLDYGEHFRGAEEFFDWVWGAHAAMQADSHQITDILADVDPGAGRGVSESYVTVCLRTKPGDDGSSTDIVDRGRYLDRWARDSDGSWRIAARRYVSDIQQVAPAAAAPPVTAVRDLTDPSYELFSGTRAR